MRAMELVWSRLHLPRPLDPERVTGLLLHLAADRRAPLLVFELRADTDGLAYLLGCDRAAVWPMRKLLGDHLPGTVVFSAPPRSAVDEVGSLRLAPPAMPLRTDNSQEVTRALLSAMSVRLRPGEVQAVQILLGRRYGPRAVPPEIPSPRLSWWESLVSGSRPASGEERRQLRVRAEQAGFDVLLRIGTRSSDRARTRRLTLGLQSALATAQGVGVQMTFVREAPVRLSATHSPRRWPLQLACAELLGLLAWPLGGDDLPGVPSLHPRPLRPATAIHRGDRVFAQPVAPGDDRPVGISAVDALLHAVAYGPTNSGKSTVMLHLIEADMKAGRPVAVLDPKRQLIDDVLARVPNERVDDVVVLDVGQSHPIGYNPLDVAGRDPDVTVDGIMAVLGGLFGDGWGPRTLDIFSGALRTLARASAATGHATTLADVPRLLTDRALRRRLVGHVARDEALAGFWAWYESLSPAGQASAIAAPLNKLRQLLLRPALMHSLDQRAGRFRLRDIWTERLIVLVPLNEALIGAGTAELFGGLVVASTLR